MGTISSAGFPVQARDLAMKPGFRGCLAGYQVKKRVIVVQRLVALAHDSEQIRKSLEHTEAIGLLGLADLDERARTPVVAQCVIVRIESARPVTGVYQIGDCLRFTVAEAEMVSQGFDLLQPLR